MYVQLGSPTPAKASEVTVTAPSSLGSCADRIPAISSSLTRARIDRRCVDLDLRRGLGFCIAESTAGSWAGIVPAPGQRKQGNAQTRQPLGVVASCAHPNHSGYLSVR